MPSAARAQEDALREERLARGLKNNEPYSYSLMELARKNPGEMKSLLEKAVKNSPDFPPAYFRLSAANLKQLPRGLFTWSFNFVEGFRAYGRNWWWALNLSGLVSLSLVASFFLSLAITVFMRFPREFPLLKHDINEKRKNLALGAIPFAGMFLGPGMFLASTLLLLALYFNKRDRLLVYMVFFFAVLSPIAVRWVIIAQSASTPRLRAVVNVNESRDNSLALQGLRERHDFPGLFSYGLALKREGRFDESISSFKAALDIREDPRAYVNLGNVHFLLGETGFARSFYETSLAIKPNPEAFFNLGQLYRDQFNFARGDEMHKKAARLDPENVSKFIGLTEQHPNKMLMDAPLGMKDFLSIVMQGEKAKSPMGLQSPEMLVPVGLSLLAFFFFFAGKLKAFRCSRCSRVLCQRCEHEPYWGRMCKDCYQSLVKLEVVDPKERVSRLLKIHGHQLRRGDLIRMLGFAPPGIALIYAGNILWGMLSLWGFLFFALTAWLNPFFTTGMAGLEHTWLTKLSVAAAATLYIISFARIRSRQGRGWL